MWAVVTVLELVATVSSVDISSIRGFTSFACDSTTYHPVRSTPLFSVTVFSPVPANWTEFPSVSTEYGKSNHTPEL